MRLIDADALIDRIKNPYEQAQVARWVNEQPTIEPEKRTEERTETHACDLIDRQAAIDTLNELHDEPSAWLDLAVDALENMPSAQPEIVRCKECKYWMPHSQLGFDEDNGTYHDYCARLVPEDEYYAFYRDADDYCSRAERRSDDGV